MPQTLPPRVRSEHNAIHIDHVSHTLLKPLIVPVVVGRLIAHRDNKTQQALPVISHKAIAAKVKQFEKSLRIHGASDRDKHLV